MTSITIGLLLSMVKLRGFGGETEFWESFTLMAGLAALTDTIKLYASTTLLSYRRAGARMTDNAK
jgi:alkanesulfonate monooxygenase SsuD/methylene tetrahydromethanopterin reductase-like flavin-dependent oxidoreductase (luciferase family)